MSTDQNNDNDARSSSAVAESSVQATDLLPTRDQFTQLLLIVMLSVGAFYSSTETILVAISISLLEIWEDVRG